MKKITLLLLLVIVTLSCNLSREKKDKSSSTFSDEIINIPKKEAKLLYEKSIESAKNNDFKTELSLLIKADSICPNTPCILTNIGTDYAIFKDYTLAINYYDRVLNINSQYSKVHVNYAKVLNHLERYSEAVEIEKKGLEIDSIHELDKKMLLFSLGISYSKLEKYDLALNALTKANECSNHEYKKDEIKGLEDYIKSKMKNK